MKLPTATRPMAWDEFLPVVERKLPSAIRLVPPPQNLAPPHPPQAPWLGAGDHYIVDAGEKR